MTFKCPYCGGDLPKEMQIPIMNDRMTRIYKAVASSGPKGIKSVNLIEALYEWGHKPAPSALGQLRVAIHGMNQKLAAINQRVKATPYRRYRLFNMEGEENGKTTEEKNLGGDRQHRNEHQDPE